MMETHKSMVDDIDKGESKTYCGKTLSIFDDSLDNDPTCPMCRRNMEVKNKMEKTE